MMAACCCGQCECDTQKCWNWYLIKHKITWRGCDEFDCCAGLVEYRSGIYFTNSCSPPTAAAVLALYKAGSIPNCPAEVDIPCPEFGGFCEGFTTEYESCQLILSAQQTVCTQTFSFPSIGPFINEFGSYPSGISFTAGIDMPSGVASGGFSYEVFGLYFGDSGYTTHRYKATGFPDPNCGTDFDYSTYGVTIIIPPCVVNAPAGCCP
jgi:hypothetical protein